MQISPAFPSLLMTCIIGQCREELSRAEDLAQQFCNLVTPPVTLSFPISGSDTSTSPTTTPTTTSAPPVATDGTSRVAVVGDVMVMGMVLGLVGLVIGFII